MQHHTVERDPGLSWVKDEQPAIEAPPDEAEGAAAPAPEAQWPADSIRTGLCGAVSPNIISLPDDSFRMFYCQMLPRAGFPPGANDYDNCTTRLLSAYSVDGLIWTPEPGVRLGAKQGGAGEFRVVSPEVAPLPDGTGRLRITVHPPCAVLYLMTAVSSGRWKRECASVIPTGASTRLA